MAKACLQLVGALRASYHRSKDHRQFWQRICFKEVAENAAHELFQGCLRARHSHGASSVHADALMTVTGRKRLCIANKQSYKEWNRHWALLDNGQLRFTISPNISEGSYQVETTTSFFHKKGWV